MLVSKKFPVTCHTNYVGPKSVFVAIKGYSTDGNQYIKTAIDQGATTIVSENTPKNMPKNITFIRVQNARKALADYCNKAFDKPCTKLKIIGITGTKGKTTTSHLVEHILKACGKKTALLGTIKNKILDKEEKATNTTPQSDYIHMFLDECVKQKVEYVVLEVSSHAISLHRTAGLTFDIIGFTNLKQDHLDFYKNKINYFNAKYRLFQQLKNTGTVVVNADDTWGKKAITRFTKFTQNSTQKIVNIKKNCLIHTPNTNLVGIFNQYNATTAYVMCKQLGLEDKKILHAIETFPGTPGRLQLHVLKNGSRAFVDFAHNPSAMEAVLQTLRPTTKDLIVVFGCGGNRDKAKRPMMGKIAADYADTIIITDDNPRFEKSEDIAKDILKGIKESYFAKASKDKVKSKCHVQLDRKKAIQHAARVAKPHSVIAVLGKGHEDYYLKDGKKYYLDDFKEIGRY